MAGPRGDARCLLWVLLLWGAARGCWAQRAGGAQGPCEPEAVCAPLGVGGCGAGCALEGAGACVWGAN